MRRQTSALQPFIMRNIFISASGQHVGKTTTTLGLVSNLRKMGYNTGYCKPVGQQFVDVNGAIADKDAVLFADVIGFRVVPEWHSPVVIGPGVTRQYLDDPTQFHFQEQILAAARSLDPLYDIVVYEGTGHPGVGSITDVSNAQVAKLLNCGTILVVEGGIGRTIDRLNLCRAIFKEQDVPIVGVIVNKVEISKKEEVTHYVGKALDQMGIPLMGVIPYDKTLLFPILETIRQAVDGSCILNEDRLNNRVEDIVAGSLVDIEEFNTFENILLVVSFKRVKEAVKKIKQISKIKKLALSPLSGVIVTGDGRHAKWHTEEDLCHPYFVEHQIPVIATLLDTYGSVLKVNRIEVKINTQTPWKVARAIELIRKHLHFDQLLDYLKST